MKFPLDTRALEMELEIWRATYEENLADKRDLSCDKVADFFCEYVLTWLDMLDDRGEPQERKRLLYLILLEATKIADDSCAKMAWKQLEAKRGEDTSIGLKAALRSELECIVRDDVASDVKGAIDFATLCEQVGVSLSNKPLA